MPRSQGAGPDDLTRFRRRNGWLLWSVALFSMAVNALMLTGPLYMLQVYDRVLGSRSEETLVALTILIAFLFLMMGVLDYVRGRVAARYGARLQEGLDGRIFRAALARAHATGDRQTALAGSPASGSKRLACLAWMSMGRCSDLPLDRPLFIAGESFSFTPGSAGLRWRGPCLLILVTVVQLQAVTHGAIAESASASQTWPGRMDRRNAGRSRTDTGHSGMQNSAFSRWSRQRGCRPSASGMRASDRVGGSPR